MNPPNGFLKRAADAGIEFESGDVERLGRYIELLLVANERMNLTGIKDPAEAWSRHVLDSLTLLPLIAAEEATSVIDVGSGGGAPGIPLAICCSAVRFTLLEATGKKAQFLQSAITSLNLPNCRVVNERAEQAGADRELHRDQYDMAIARAVGPLNVLLELTVPLARVGGFVLAIKGEKANQEIEDARGAIHRLHVRVNETIRTETGTVIVIEKLRTTPKIYPRRPGEPKRNPLT